MKMKGGIVILMIFGTLNGYEKLPESEEKNLFNSYLVSFTYLYQNIYSKVRIQL